MQVGNGRKTHCGYSIPNIEGVIVRWRRVCFGHVLGESYLHTKAEDEQIHQRKLIILFLLVSHLWQALGDNAEVSEDVHFLE